MTNSDGQKRKRLNQRLITMPIGAVLTSHWLKGQGISSKLANYYVKSGWLHRVGEGAFTARPGNPTWLGAVFGLQQRSASFHPGGRTALELSGLAHFIPMGEAYPLYIFSGIGDRFPVWFKGLPWSERVRHMSTSFLPKELGLTDHRDGELVVKVSSPERAALEFLHTLAPADFEYDHADLVFEGFRTFRPELVQSLLEACTSVKVKRLFLHLAEKHDLSWLKQLNLERVSLGSGKRVFVARGHLDPKYLITVPAAFAVPPDAP